MESATRLSGFQFLIRDALTEPFAYRAALLDLHAALGKTRSLHNVEPDRQREIEHLPKVVSSSRARPASRGAILQNRSAAKIDEGNYEGIRSPELGAIRKLFLAFAIGSLPYTKRATPVSRRGSKVFPISPLNAAMESSCVRPAERRALGQLRRWQRPARLRPAPSSPPGARA
jgi:hypothetical protein